MIREVIRMEKVTYKEQGRILLDNFNITVRKGEVFGLIPVNRYGLDAFLKLLQQNMPLHYGYVYYREQLVNQWQRSHNQYHPQQKQSGGGSNRGRQYFGPAERIS